MSLEFLEGVVSRLQAGRRLVVATILEAMGSTPREEGAKMAIEEDGSILGTLGGGAFEALVIEDAKALLAIGGTLVKEYRFREGEEPESTGMVCGGQVRVHLQVEQPPERLLIFGAGHVGNALARVAVSLGFATIVLDDRAEMLEENRFPPGVELRLAGSEFSGPLPPIDGSTYIAIVTRCHRTDLAALRRVAKQGAAYVGLIGSRRKVKIVLSRLAEEGLEAGALSNLHSPIGIPIGACTPEEIAVSIAAELIQIRRGASLERSEAPSTASTSPVERHRERRG